MTDQTDQRSGEFRYARGACFACLLLMACVYAYGAWRQGVELNLSETAGGQAPYLRESKRISERGIAHYLGDRNRMPAIPALLSVFYNPDAATFFRRAKWVSVVMSMVALGGLCWLLIGGLPWAPGILAVSITAFAVFLPKASFVQAELVYYTLFFATWLMMCRLLYLPRIKTAIVAGAVAGCAYWVKASVLPLVVVFLAGSIFAAVMRRQKQSDGRSEEDGGRSGWKSLTSGVVVGVVFLLVVSPYLLDNKARFGHYFYNVNSTFFMWCDSWSEAKTFADQYDISERYPNAPPAEIPSAWRYFRTHSPSQAVARLVYGLKTFGRQFRRGAYSRYILALGVVCLLLAWRHRGRVHELVRDDALVVGFTFVVISGYVLVYAWYAIVAFGDRFILSLFLPVLFAERFFISRTGTRMIRWKPFGLSLKLSDAVAIVLTAVAFLHGIRAATHPLKGADEAFVHFYFNESREAQLAGDLDVAVRGYRGVVRLDPTFAAAHHELGMIALRSGRFSKAIAECREAVRLSPSDANFLNSLGSALIQGGKTSEAIGILEQAIRIDPGFVSALYNLGGAYWMMGQRDRANEIADQLDSIDRRAAGNLRALLENSQRSNVNGGS